jgi:hypothetical protein
MNIPKEQCNPGNFSEYARIFSDISKVDDITYIDDFKNKIKEYSINDNYNIMNIIIINILFNAIEIFNIKDYEYNFKLHHKLYQNINYLLQNLNNLTSSNIDSLIMSDIKSYISSYLFFEKCLANNIFQKEEELKKEIEQSKKENIIEEINNLNAKSKGVKEINIHLIAIEKSLNIFKYHIGSKEFKNIVSQYFEYDTAIEDYCSNIILLIIKINNITINTFFEEFKNSITNTDKHNKDISVKKASFFNKNFSRLIMLSKKTKTDNHFLIFFKKILVIYKNNNTDNTDNINKLLFYIAKLYHIYKKLNKDTTKYDGEPPDAENIDSFSTFLSSLLKRGGKNKNEFINYKFENKVYRRKVRYDGKKKYIILDKTRIYIKK